MRSIKMIFILLISSLVLQSTVYANVEGVHPKHKLTREVTWKLDRADYLDLNGKSIETTIVLMVDDKGKFVIVDTGTDNLKLDKYIKCKLNQKKVRTRKAKKNVYYYLTVRFIPKKMS